MKKVYLFVAVMAMVLLNTNFSQAQIGYISNYASVSACNIAVDNAGMVYTANGRYVQTIAAGGHITNVVGGGSSYGDGGPATAAKLSSAYNVKFDNAGNMYIADAGYSVIRKVNTSGIISTVAGNYSLGSGYTGDGGPATAAKINCTNVCVDAFGNLFIADESHFVIRKVDAGGIITTVAGNGYSGYSGDGGPATAAKLNYYSEANIWGMTTDAAGNLYISAGYDYRVRKVSTSGIITTVAGNGLTGSGGVGGPATAANMYYPQGLTTDNYGNIYMCEWQNCVLAVMNTAGILNTVAGNYTISHSGDGGPATAAGLNAVSDVAIDKSGNIYIADCHNSCIRVVTGFIISTTDSFSARVVNECNGADMTLATHSYAADMYIKSDFGDGATDSTNVLPGFISGGYAFVKHSYNAAGSYTITQVLYRGGAPIDTITTSYNYTFCRTLPVKIFYDANGNCVKDPLEPLMSLPSVAAVDSNGVVVDTVSVTSGLNYNAYCAPGSIYSFRLITKPGDMVTPCTGFVKDTVSATVSTYPDKYIGLSCPTSSSYDFGVNAVVPVTGVNDQWGNIYVKNAACLAAGATVTLHFSPKWDFSMGESRPTPTSVSGNTATWNISAVSSGDANPIDLYYVLRAPKSGPLTIRDTVHSYYEVTPIAGDIDTTNNTDTRVDTIRAGCDPNEMFVDPAGCIPVESLSKQLRYTINFENTGNDTAHNIYVMDTLPAEVNPSSLRVVMASANMNIGMLKYGNRTIARFDFPLINLRDSSHHGECDGTVIFTIDKIGGLGDGATIMNRAGIYFDYNDVVMTNEVVNTIGCPALQLPDHIMGGMALYPNPANDEITIETVADKYSSYNVTNTLGQVVAVGNIAGARTKVNISSLSSGVYHVTLKGAQGSAVRKFVKL